MGSGAIRTGISVFPAGVEESDAKRGEPRNAKRRMTRRTRITLARRSQRKRDLRLKLIEAGLLPPTAAEFKTLLETTDPWELRRKGLDEPLTPHEFGRVLLHLAQRRGALGLHVPDPEEEEEAGEAGKEDGKVKAAIGAVRAKMLEKKARTFGEFIAMVRDERVTRLEDKRPEHLRKGPREWRRAVRNKAASYEHCADRAMIRDEFRQLWEKQASLPGPTTRLLTDDLRLALDDESGDATWRHKGLLFGQRRQSWNLGTLGRCSLHPEERCVPHADMHASRYLVVETVNNLKIVEWGKATRPLTPEERERIAGYLSGPLGTETRGKRKGQPKRTVTVTDLRRKMAEWYGKDLWTHDKKRSPCRFRNEESDEERPINTDWFSREIVHGAVTPETWAAMPKRVREGLNRAILKFDPDQEEDAAKLKAGVMDWAGLSEAQADALVAAWRTRPKPDAKRLSMSRRAVRNLLTVMDRPEPWHDAKSPTGYRWLTQIEARKLLAGNGDFVDATTGQPLDDITRRRYATGAKGATARDRYYMGRHVLMKNGRPIIDRDTGRPLAEPPPAPLISNPVVRKAIHEVRRHLVEYMIEFERRPDQVYIELAREARMGKKDADRLLFKNRLRNRIRNDIIHTGGFGLNGPHVTSTQQRAAVDRVVLCVQQGGRCPLCGEGGLTTFKAAKGVDCEVAHIIPRASGGHNGLSNIVLAHTKCNREMGRRTPRQYWSEGPGFEQGMVWARGIYGDIKRPKPSEVKGVTGEPLWACYFTQRDDTAKIERFKLDVSSAEVQGMTERQDAATKYAARQIMAYLADALYGGKGLPERSTGADDRRIFATDGMWTSRLRREWGLFFDPHKRKSHEIDEKEKHERNEKDRGDHRHHAIDAVVIALCNRQVQLEWEEREREADKEKINTADEDQMENYRRLHPIDPPAPFKSREDLRAAVERSVFGDDGTVRPVCHRPVKRKLIGALHEETLFGPVLDASGNLTGNYTAKKSVLALDPNHLRLPRAETKNEAIDRLAERRRRDKGISEREARKWAKALVESPAWSPKIVDPPPGKSGIVRDPALRRRLRACLEEGGLNPDDFSETDIKRLYEAGRIRHASGVPIHSVVLLRTMNDPVIVDRKKSDYATGRLVRDDNPASKRAYLGGNNHHIEIRVNDKGAFSGEIVSAFEAAQRKLARLRAFREAGIPKPDEFRKLPLTERRRLSPVIRAIEQAHPLVDRRDDVAKGGRFLMSLCEGEMLWMKHKDKESGEVGYFVVAKLDKPNRVVLVPHWDARAATERKDAEGNKVPDSKREQFSIVPSDLKTLGPPGHEHAVKVRVSRLGEVQVLERD